MAKAKGLGDYIMQIFNKTHEIGLNITQQDIWCLPTLPKDVTIICFTRGPAIGHG